MASEMPFEQPLVELRAKIEELRKFSRDKQIDFSEEIARLEHRLAELEAELYASMSTRQKKCRSPATRSGRRRWITSSICLPTSSNFTVTVSMATTLP